MNINNENSSILAYDIYFKTWQRDSHGLFDYECTQTKNHQEEKKTERSCKIIRKKQEIRLENENYEEKLNQDEMSLGLIKYDQTGIYRVI